MSNLSLMYSRTLCFLMRMRNCRYYNVKKSMLKGILRGSDENVKSTDSRKSGKRMGFKDKNSPSSKTIRCGSERIRVSKLYASLHSAIMESVLEKSWKSEKLFQTHFKNSDSVEDIRNIIRKRLDLHSVSNLDNLKKLELARIQEQKDVEEHLNQNRTSLLNRVHSENDVSCSNRRRQIEIKTKNRIDMLQNSRRIIHSQSSSMPDKLSKSDCVNYFKWNRTFSRDKNKTKNQRILNKSENSEKYKLSTQSYTSNNKNAMSLESSIPPIHQLQDEARIIKINNNDFNKENKIIDQCTENNKSIGTDQSLKGKKMCIVASFDEKTPSFLDDIQHVIKNPDIKNGENDHQNKEPCCVEPESSLNLNHDSKQLNGQSDQSNIENTVETLRYEKDYEESQNSASKPTLGNIDGQEERKKCTQESFSNSSKYLSNLIEFVSYSKNHFSDLQKKLELFGLDEEAKNLEDYSKSINQSLQLTILDDVSLYLLGLQKRLLTYCSDNTGEQSTGIPNVRTTTDNILSILDNYLEKPETIEKKIISKLNNDYVSFNDLNHVPSENSENVNRKRECSEVKEILRSEESKRIQNNNSIDIEKNNLSILNIQHSDREEKDVAEESAKNYINDSVEDKYEIDNTDNYLSNEGNDFFEKNYKSSFDVDESDQILYNYSKESPVLEYKNDLVRGLQQSKIESISTSDDENLLGIDGSTGDSNSDLSLKSGKINNSLLSLEQCDNPIDSKSSGESEYAFENSERSTPNSYPDDRASKLQNKKNLKAKKFLHSNYWKNHANSYHTVSRYIPWVIGKKCLIETSEVEWKSQNNNVLITTEKSIEMEDSQDSNHFSESVNTTLHGKLRKKFDIGNQSFNTCSKVQNLSNVGNKKDKLLENVERSKFKQTTNKRNYSIDHETNRNFKLEREKNKLSVKELFPEKKSIKTAEESTSIEDVKLEVVGKKIVLQEPPEVEERIIPEDVLVEAAEEFLPSKSKYGIGVSNVEGLEKQTEQVSEVTENFHEITEEMILDSFGITTAINNIYEDSRNSARNSISESFNGDDASERINSNYESYSKIQNDNETVDDESESGEYYKAPLGFMQSQQNNHLERSRGNAKKFPGHKQIINNYEEI